MANATNQWLWGLFVSMLVGGFVTEFTLKGLRKMRDVEKGEESNVWSPWITGFIERGFFTVAVALQFPGFVAAMVGWIALKMVTHWQRMVDKSDDRTQIDLAFTALLAGLVSMFFAILGGLICRGVGFV